MSPRVRKTRRHTAPKAVLAVSAPPAAQDMALSFRWGWYLISLFVPFAGILIALFLYDRDEKEVRRIGRNCLLIGFVFWVLAPLLIGFLVLVYTVLCMAGWVTDAMDTGN